MEDRLFYVTAHTKEWEWDRAVFFEIETEDEDNYITKEWETIRKDFVYSSKTIPEEWYNFYNVWYVPDPEYIYKDDSFKIEIWWTIYMYNEIRDIYNDLTAR